MPRKPTKKALLSILVDFQGNTVSLHLGETAARIFQCTLLLGYHGCISLDVVLCILPSFQVFCIFRLHHSYISLYFVVSLLDPLPLVRSNTFFHHRNHSVFLSLPLL